LKEVSEGVVGVVSGRHGIRTQVFEGELLEAVKFDVLVTQQVGIRRPAFGVLLEQVGENTVPVFLDEVDLVEGDLQLLANPFGVLGILDAVARTGFLLVVPVLHVHPVHIET